MRESECAYLCRACRLGARACVFVSVQVDDFNMCQSCAGTSDQLLAQDALQRTAVLLSVIHHKDNISNMLLKKYTEHVNMGHTHALSAPATAAVAGGNAASGSGVTRHRTRGGRGVQGQTAGPNRHLAGMINLKDASGKAALHYAVDDVEEQLHVVASLLQAKAEVNIKQTSDGNSPLHIACQHGHVMIVKTLVNHNASIGAKNRAKRTALHVAAEHLQIKIVSILLEASSEAKFAVCEEDSAGATVLHCAINNRSRRSLDGGSTHGVEIRGDTSVELLKEKEEELQQLLLRHGADLKKLNSRGLKPIEFDRYYEEHENEIHTAVKDHRAFTLATLGHWIVDWPLFHIRLVNIRLKLWLRCCCCASHGGQPGDSPTGHRSDSSASLPAVNRRKKSLSHRASMQSDKLHQVGESSKSILNMAHKSVEVTWYMPWDEEIWKQKWTTKTRKISTQRDALRIQTRIFEVRWIYQTRQTNLGVHSRLF